MGRRDNLNAEVLKNILELLCSKNEEICSLKLQEQIRANIEVYEEFLNAILKPDLTKALSLSNEFIKSDADIKIFFESVILPSLYSVGNKWENCEISVSQEHTATSICQKIMSEYYPRIIKYINKKQKVLVTMSPGEFHQVGGRMLADIIELEGYDVIFLNSDSSSKEKLNAIELENIDYVVISTT